MTHDSVQRYAILKRKSFKIPTQRYAILKRKSFDSIISAHFLTCCEQYNGHIFVDRGGFWPPKLTAADGGLTWWIDLSGRFNSATLPPTKLPLGPFMRRRRRCSCKRFAALTITRVPSAEAARPPHSSRGVLQREKTSPAIQKLKVAKRESGH